MSSTKVRNRTTSTDTNDTFVTTNNSPNNTLPLTTNLANAVVEKSLVDCGATILDYYDQLLNEVSIHDIPTTTTSSSTLKERKRVRFTTNCGTCFDEDTTIDNTILTYPSQEGDSTTIIPPPPPITTESSIQSSTKDEVIAAENMPTLTQVLDEELDRACFDTLTYFCGDPCGPSSTSNSPSQKNSKHHRSKPSTSSTYNPNDITEFLGRGKDPSTYGENPDSLISGSVSWWSSIVSSFDTRTKEDDDTLSTDGGGTIPVGKTVERGEGGACNPVLPEYLVGAVCCGEEDSKPTSKSPVSTTPLRLKKSSSFQPVRIHLLYRDRSSASNTSCVEFKTLEGSSKSKNGKLGGGKTGGFANVVLKKATSLTRNISFGSRQRSGVSAVNDSKVEEKKKSKGPSSPSRSVQSTSTKESNSTTASSSDHTPITVKAVDSLGRKETVWKEYVDATTGKVYYSNGIKVSWNRPLGNVVVAKSNQKKKKYNDIVGSQSNTTEGGVHKSTLRRLFNVSGGVSKKMDTKKSSVVVDKKKVPAYRQVDRHGKNSKSKKKKKVWKEYVDASSGKCYYSNGIETTWVKPQQ